MDYSLFKAFKLLQLKKHKTSTPCILSVITSHCAVNSLGYWRVSVTDTSRVLLIVWKRCKACILRLSPGCCVNKVTVFVNARRAIHILLTPRMVTVCCVFCADKAKQRGILLQNVQIKPAGLTDWRHRRCKKQKKTKTKILYLRNTLRLN